MSTTTKARRLFDNRRLAAKWVMARRYLDTRGLPPYAYLPMSLHIVRTGNSHHADIAAGTSHRCLATEAPSSAHRCQAS